MRAFVGLPALLLAAGAAAAEEVAQAADWERAASAARACATQIVRQPALPEGINAFVHKRAYRLHQQATPAQRQCFYRRLGIGEAEQLLHELEVETK